MTAKNRVHDFANNFWKHASSTKGVLSLEDAYIDWSNDSGMTISEFKHVWSKINDDINTKYGLKKADISFSRTDDILDLVNLLKSTGIEDGDLESLESLTGPEPELNESLNEPSFEMNEEKIPTTPPGGGMGEEPGTPELEEGGSPELKLTESLLL